MPIYCNGKGITPKFNGKDLSRVMFNGKQVWPSPRDVIYEFNIGPSFSGQKALSSFTEDLISQTEIDKINYMEIEGDFANNLPAGSGINIKVMTIFNILGIMTDTNNKWWYSPTLSNVGDAVGMSKSNPSHIIFGIDAEGNVTQEITSDGETYTTKVSNSWTQFMSVANFTSSSSIGPINDIASNIVIRFLKV